MISKPPDTLVNLLDENGKTTDLWIDLALVESWDQPMDAHEDHPGGVGRITCCAAWDQKMNRTPSGIWFLTSWSRGQTAHVRYIRCSRRDAGFWLAICEHALPRDVLDAFHADDLVTLQRLKREAAHLG